LDPPGSLLGHNCKGYVIPRSERDEEPAVSPAQSRFLTAEAVRNDIDALHDESPEPETAKASATVSLAVSGTLP